MSFSGAIGLVCFFIIFLFSFSIIPRLIFVFLRRFFSFDKDKGFFNNYFSLLISYLILGIPLTILLYQASSFGKPELIKNIFGDNIGAMSFMFVLIVLSSIRISLIMKKREYLEKIKLLKKFVNFIPKIDNKDREKLNQEYFSFVFELFFASFFFAGILLLFNILFLSENTMVSIPHVYMSVAEMYKNICEIIKPFIKYGVLGFIITFAVELLIKLTGNYELKI